jgi:hypothetical protein
MEFPGVCAPTSIFTKLLGKATAYMNCLERKSAHRELLDAVVFECYKYCRTKVTATLTGAKLSKSR